MKKLFTTLVIGFSLSLQAQTTLTTAVDFTVTTTDAQSFNLFTKLAEGKYVVVDFFFVTCPPCQSTAPYYKATFENYGCNEGSVYFISIDQGDTEAQVESFEATYLSGADIPAVSGTEGGGDPVNSAYGISAYPTYILIAPNHDIVEQDMWPISSAADFTNYLTTQNGIAQQACASSGVEDLSNVHISLYPNPTVDRVNIASLKEINVTSVEINNMYGQVVLSQDINPGDALSFDVSGLSTGMYVMSITTDKGVRQETFNKQ